ncbi:MAG: PQQ-dependent sugar dehydrogenase [Pyrinomonadaceae bacterium]
MVKLKILAILLFAAVGVVLFFTDNPANRGVHAFSAGPPAGYTRAPGEEPEACAECHVVESAGTGQLTLAVPQSYEPGRSYNITVTHANADQTRTRWGFQLTALDPADEKAGTLEPLDNLTQVLNNQGPFPSRQYVEHTSAGTFFGQRNGASWTFRWTAPAEDVGPVTFYVAGNQANGDGNNSGDNVYFTFAASTFTPPTPDFSISVSPASRTVVRGSDATYDVTVTPLNGFTGTVTLSASGLPAGATANFQPASVNLSGATPQTSTLTVSTSGSTTTGPNTFNVNAESGALTHTAQAGLNVAAQTDADLAVTQTVSPNPAQTNADIRYTFNVTNNGPAAAQAVRLIVIMPNNFATFTEGANGDKCLLGPAGANLGYDCTLDALPAGQSITVDFTLRTANAGVINTTTTVDAVEHDPFPSNNTVQFALGVTAQSGSPSMTVPGLGVRTVVSGLDQPTALAFIGPKEFLVLERATGRVVRVKDGVTQGVALDLPVNSASERGLLGIALHPNFASNGFVYLYWTESTTGQDTTAIEAVPLLGNRVDRYVMAGPSLFFDRTLLRLRALQTDAGQPPRGNHNGGVLRFGPDSKLYVLVGDVGRRGFFQNLPCGPTTTCPTNPPLVQDDEFGGPEPDDAHATGAIFRLNDDGTTPVDNPYAQIPTVQGGPIVDNIRRLYAYGVRNSFGMDFDPVGGFLWTQENGDDAFDEINRVESGFNGGWAQLMGPSSRIAEFKSIEVARGNSLQQNRWPPSNIADTAAQALARLYQLPGSKYTEPEFSWKYAVAPSPVGFAGSGLGTQYAGDLFVGASRTTLLGGYLMRFDLSGDRKTLATNDSRLADKVADNSDKFDLSESESLVVGRDFGITTDIRTEPSKGTLYVVSLSNGAVYEVYDRPTSVVRFVADNFVVSEGAGFDTIRVERSGDTTAAAAIRYKTYDGSASERSDYTTASGVLNFAPGETVKSFVVLVTDDGLKEGDETVGLLLEQLPGGDAVADPPNAVLKIVDNDAANSPTNPVDDSQFFVRQHYHDFLNREPDASGFQFWTSEIEGCGADALCREVKRVNVSAAFFLSIEFQRTGLLAYLANRAAFGNATTDPRVPVRYADFVREGQALQRGYAFGQPGAEAVLEANRRAYFDEFVARPEFVSKYGAMTNDQFVSALLVSNDLNATVGNVHVARLDAAQQVPPGASTAAGLFVLTRPSSGGSREATVSLSLDDLSSPVTAVHIHGPAMAGAGAPAIVTLPAGEFADFHFTFTQEQLNDLFGGRLYVDVHTQNNPDGEIRAQIPVQRFRQDVLTKALDDHVLTRAQVFRIVAEFDELRQAEFRRAFVLMQYFGYLRRDPDAEGFNFWLSKLNAFDGDYIRAEMVKAFISSNEYRQRFGSN